MPDDVKQLSMPPALEEASVTLDEQLRLLWRLGRNVVVGWCTAGDHIKVLAVPQFVVPLLLQNHEEILEGTRHVTESQLSQLSDICEIEPYEISLPEAFGERKNGELKVLEDTVERYSIVKKVDKEFVLLDIVEYSLFSPLEQVTALNSLAYSINVAVRRAQEHQVPIEINHSPTGDGFYIWNKKDGYEANIDLFCTLMLILSDNALGQAQRLSPAIPRLRAAFHIGSVYQYHQAEDGKPGRRALLTGSATIELARMLTSAQPNQILVGNFLSQEAVTKDATPRPGKLDAIEFFKDASGRVESLVDVVLSREKIKSIHCYLTGSRRGENLWDVNRYIVTDKHGRRHEVFNMKMNVHRYKGSALWLGVQDGELKEFGVESVAVRAESDEEGERLISDTRHEAAPPAGEDDASQARAVLVVEDDRRVQETAVNVLERCGFRVITASTGEEGVKAIEQGEHFALLFTDIVMPGRINGVELAQFAKQRLGDCPIILSSGYPSELEAAAQATGSETLVKPYGAKDLEDLVTRVLA